MHKLFGNNEAYVKVAIGIIAFFITLSASILVFYEFADTVQITNASNKSGYDTQMESVRMFGTIVPLLVLIGLVVVAGMIIMIIGKFGK